MTQVEDSPTDAEGSPKAERRSYFVDPTWHERNGRRFAAFVESRVCPSCRRKLEEGRETTQGEPTGGSRSKGNRQRPPADPVATIQSCCVTATDFITPRLPVLEAVFRLLLAKGSPMDAEQIRESLSTWPGVEGAYSHLSADMLEHLLESDSYYGFRPYPHEGEGQ